MLTLSRHIRRPVCAILRRQWPTATAISQDQTQAQTQTRQMSKYLPKSAAKRLPLTTKRARKGYYKGKGSTKQGTHTGRAGRYVMDRDRMLEIIAPDMEGFKLKPYIASTVPIWAPEDRREDLYMTHL